MEASNSGEAGEEELEEEPKKKGDRRKDHLY